MGSVVPRGLAESRSVAAVVLPIPCAFPFTGGLPDIVREQMMAIDAKRK